MATATEIFDQANGWANSYGYRGSQIVGERFFRVDDVRPDEVYGATGLPSIGSNFGGSFTNLPCTGRQIVRQMGGDQTTGGGYSIVRCEYASAGASFGGAEASSSSDAYTEIVTANESQPTNVEGDGTAIEYDGLSFVRILHELRVTSFRANLSWLSHWREIASKATSPGRGRPSTNSNAVDVPDIRGLIGSGFTCAIGQLLPIGMQIEPYSEGLVKVTFSFAYRSDHKVSFFNEDEDGAATGSEQTADIYPSAAINNTNQLWTA